MVHPHVGAHVSRLANIQKAKKNMKVPGPNHWIGSEEWQNRSRRCKRKPGEKVEKLDYLEVIAAKRLHAFAIKHKRVSQWVHY